MVEVYPGLFVGNQEDYRFQSSFPSFTEKFSFIGASKYPWHKDHAKIDGSDKEGYIGKAMPKDSAEYLYAEREHALYCNLIDVEYKSYIPVEIIDKCVQFITRELYNSRKVLICCNKGESRAPTIAFIYMIIDGAFDDCENFDGALYRFKRGYPNYKPNNGIFQHLLDYWEENNGKKEDI